MRFHSSRKGVELHLHVDGALRPSTLFAIANRRGLANSCETVEEFTHKLVPKSPYSLGKFLETFQYITPVISDDKEAITQMALECIEDCALKSGLCYVELRFAPHLLAGRELDAEAVTLTVLEAVRRAGQEYGIEVRLILCIIREMPETADEVVQLATKYQGHGVVGIDIAGDDSRWHFTDGVAQPIVQAFQQAERDQVHRTAHAGENSPAAAVHEALHDLRAERIGHGYNVIHDHHVYNQVKEKKIHFEVCPSSSLVTGSVCPIQLDKHPIHRFITDGVSYSLNTDDPLLTGKWIHDELKFCAEHLGLSTAAIELSKLHAIEASFLDTDEERALLLEHVLLAQ